MTCEQIKKLLSNYNISTLNELEYSLEMAYNTTDECIDDPKEKNCTNSKCYEEFFVPDCRKLIEIYKKYFYKEIVKKDLFVEYLDNNTSKSTSSISNYMSCKSCNQQIKKGVQTSLKISDYEFKKDFCNNLSIKFNYTSLFETDYTSIKQFLSREHQITSDNFIPIYDKEDTMTKEEEKKLFDIVHTSKDKFKNNLNNQKNLQGSDKYLFNLAKYAFDRNLVDESDFILDKLIQNSKEFIEQEEYMQLKAKILSSQQKDKEAIEILTKLSSSIKPNINTETNNLLAASIKREAFSEFEKYSDETVLINKLKKAKNIYYSVYSLNKDYYPALNYIYLQFMLGYIDGNNQNKFQSIKDEAIKIWEQVDHQINDWWSFIAHVEYLILLGKYSKAKKELDSHFNDLETMDISDFNIFSTVRQLELYSKFCTDKELHMFIEYINNKFNNSVS